MFDAKPLMLNSFQACVASVDPYNFIRNHIPRPPKGRMIVIGAGKASARMAAAFEDAYDGVIEGIVVTRYDYGVKTQDIKIMEAAHPVPDTAGQEAAQAIIALLQTATEDDLVVCLISGGGSALLTAPVDGVSFEELQELNVQLLKSGADIHEINTVRKHLNIALGGGLAKAAGNTKVITLSISDVVGDDPSTIASGATVADETTLEDARAVLTKHGIEAHENIKAALSDDKNETPNKGDPVFDNNEYHIVASGRTALDTASDYWAEHGFDVRVFDTEVSKDTNEAAHDHITFITDILENEKINKPCAILSGGETTVKITGNGKGGPNTQFMLQSTILLNGRKNVYGLACDTDGIDGTGNNAGALITPDTLSLASSAQVNAEEYLSANDSYAFFDKIDQLVKSGPTFTNVNDYRVFLLLP